MRRRAKQQTSRSVNVPAPLGGINTVDAGGAMPDGDALMGWNVIAGEYGLRSRLGYREWCTGLEGAADNTVRSVLQFTGSAKSGAADKLFACTDLGIYDVSASTDAPTRLIDFPSSAGDAGYGTAVVASTAAGRFLLYCDETNGLYIYSETSGTWSRAVSGTTQEWAASTIYTAGIRVTNAGNVYQCATGGTSTGTGPTGTGTAIADGTATWDYVSAVVANVIGPCLADQRLGYTADPANFVQVTVWKNRAFFVERDTARAYYLDINAIYGTATSFNFGSRMKAGGPLVGLFNWSYDGGGGLDTHLVGISGGGDVVIYTGTDPSSVSTFGLKGCWSVGAVPAGRRIATDYGGDLLVLSLTGVVPLSKLVVGASADDAGIYATRKISNLFNQLASTRRTRNGWALYIQPTDNALYITVPSIETDATEQLVMSLAKKSWSRYRDLPILSGGVWAGEFYFGTADGRVCRHIDYVDNVQLDDADSYDEVQCLSFSAYSNLGNARQKRILMLRPTFLSGASTAVWSATAKYRFDLLEPSAPSGSLSGGWDTGLWDAEVFGADYNAVQGWTGATGMGRDVAIAVRWSAVSRTVLVGYDVLFEVGGIL